MAVTCKIILVRQEREPLINSAFINAGLFVRLERLLEKILHASQHARYSRRRHARARFIPVILRRSGQAVVQPLQYLEKIAVVIGGDDLNLKIEIHRLRGIVSHAVINRCQSRRFTGMLPAACHLVHLVPTKSAEVGNAFTAHVNRQRRQTAPAKDCW